MVDVNSGSVRRRAQPLRVGIVGRGFAASVHARAATVAGARLVGIAATSAESAVQGAAALRAGAAYPTAEALVTAADVDVVHICTTNDLHAPLARLALETGKHVVCEKPLALTPAETSPLVEAAARAGRVAAVPFVYRYYPMVREARERVRAGQLGQIVLVHGSYLQDWLLDAGSSNWRVDPARGGPSRAFADIGSHWCDLLEFVVGERIVELSATLDVTHPSRPSPNGAAKTFGASSRTTVAPEPVRTEDAAAVTFRLKSGALGSLLVSQAAAGHANHLVLEIAGTESSVAFDQQAPERLRLGRVGHETWVWRDPNLLSAAGARYARLPAGHAQGYQDCVDAFVGEVYAAVREGAVADGMPTFADGHRAAELTAAVLRSHADNGAWTTPAQPDGQVPLLTV